MHPTRLGKEQADPVLNPTATDPSSAIALDLKKPQRGEGDEVSSDVTDREDDAKKSPDSQNRNNNSSSGAKRSSDSPYSAISSKSPRLGSDCKPEPIVKEVLAKLDNSLSNRTPLNGAEQAALYRQAMQLASLQRRQALKNQIPSLNLADESSPARSNSSRASAVSPLPGNDSSVANQMQQLLTQQMIGPQHLQALMQQQALTAQQQQAQQLQDIYKQQLQEFQLQLATANLQPKAENVPMSGSDGSRNGNGSVTNGISSKFSKEQQHMQQQMALRQLLQMQQHQQQQQQQQQAVAALQQHQGLIAAMALAQQGQHNFISPDAASELQQLLKHLGDENTLKEEPFPQPRSGSANGIMTNDNTFERLALSAALSNEAPGYESQEKNRSVSNRFSANHSSREGTPEEVRSSSSSQPLYSRGFCKWPGCETECADPSMFQRHLEEHHCLNDKTTAQYRVQLQIVEQLEKQLIRERERLEAMSGHLTKIEEQCSRQDMNMCSSAPAATAPTLKTSSHHGNPLQTPGLFSNFGPNFPHPPTNLNHPPSPVSAPNLQGFPNSVLRTPTSTSPPPTFPSSLGSASREPMLQQVGKRRSSGNAPISSDLLQNQDFYKNADVRPPFTYASLIRQAIIESPDCQMTLNEIYNWFQKKFAYFRRNAPTWKSAIRTNLSLHKCFKRCEDVMGSYWTVDDREFRKGRHLKRGRPRKYEEKEQRPQSPAIRGRSDTSTSPNFYGAPMGLAALQMMFGDSSVNPSQLVSQAAQAMIANQSNFSNFIHPNLRGLSNIPHSTESEPSANSQHEEDRSNDVNASKVEYPPIKEEAIIKENARCDDDEPDDTKHNITTSEIRNQQSMNVKAEAKTQNEGKAFATPNPLRDEDTDDFGSSRQSTLSEGSAEDAEKPLHLSQIPPYTNGLHRQNIVSARGSFAMLHDPSGQE